ncbi:FxDxF family PEP-CTERM protein [Roseateles sp. LKC17W]|uniref:FxDxF family PEP-CTERM protein n=1 Tax=Pelomonas margarita TaxID=3299031 RepID=A0ABW7FD23_9BURK
MKLKLLAAASLVALSATAAQAVTLVDTFGGAHDSFETVTEAGIAAPFFETYAFTLGSTSNVQVTFASFNVLGAVGLYKAGGTPVDSFAVGGTQFSGSDSWTLAAGSYFYGVSGTGTAVGSYTLTSTVAAVPEPETYALLAAGLGIVGFVASRRRRND